MKQQIDAAFEKHRSPHQSSAAAWQRMSQGLQSARKVLAERFEKSRQGFNRTRKPQMPWSIWLLRLRGRDQLGGFTA